MGSENDPTPIDTIIGQQCDTIRLDLWEETDTNWPWIEGFIDSIWYDPQYLEVLEADIDTETLISYMYKGVRVLI